MKKNLFATVLSIASISAGAVFGVDVDSRGSATQDYSFILDSGNSISVSISRASPKVTGNYPDGSAISNPYASVSATQIEAKWDYKGTSLGISTGSPYFGELTYTDGILTNSGAKVTSNETAIIASRSVGDGFKFFGGIRLNQFKATIDRAFVPGVYKYEVDTGTSTGFAVGAAYEVPQIMLRASIQYNTEIKHKNAKETETVANVSSETTPNDMIAPSSMIIKLRSALSPRLLAYANWRSSQYKDFVVSGTLGGELHNPESGSDLTVGIALKVNDKLNVALGGARGQSKDTGGLASPLAPYKGTSTQFLGASFKINDQVELNAAYSLTSFGDANANVISGTGVFEDNKSSRVTLGTKINF